ncbi:N-acetyltransferase [Actinobacteria bacterium YIM 96077]|uniref:N-acetyltransferase domain-containing protein n=2 Tax=Phytoactinopolyspora halophila TaxID=1981511 RepID=A0A329QI45_9ACTN|nr:GNAT family protein [Phytoactinopolyspora halophila]AYY13949.1 N-acetyltransferase [Actinobacteria bacterium YIM 96077]RAW10078.1 hypothetical protein DPM12_19645 [Phytoactinopolyspora halophila]
MFDVTATTPEVGFWLHPEARGASHAAGALDLAARLAARSGLTELTARTLTENLPSKRSLERAGFSFVEEAIGRTPAGDDVSLAHYCRILASGEERQARGSR